MGWKIRMVDVDGSEEFIDTSDLLDKATFVTSMPLLLRFVLDLRGAVGGRREAEREDCEPGVWLKIGVYDAQRAPTLIGHEPRRSPQCDLRYDLPLVDKVGLARLARLEWDGKAKLVRVPGPAGRSSLVDVSRMEAARERLVSSDERTSLNESAYTTFCALYEAARRATGDNEWPGGGKGEEGHADHSNPRGGEKADDKTAAAWEKTATALAAEMGWSWDSLRPVIAAGDERAAEEARTQKNASDGRAGGDGEMVDCDSLDAPEDDEYADEGYMEDSEGMI